MRDQLKNYRAICAELEDVTAELDSLSVTDAVQTAATPPYSKHSVSVSGLPPTDRVKTLLAKQAALRTRKSEAERFVESCPEEMRYILTQKYFKGRSNLYIAMQLGYRDETVIRRKIKKFFSKAEKADF